MLRVQNIIIHQSPVSSVCISTESEVGDSMETDYYSFAKDLPPRYRTGKVSGIADDSEASNAPHRSSPVELEKVSAESDSESSSINENYDVQSLASSIEDQLTWRGRMQVALHSHWFHIFIVLLVVLDAFIVLFELLLDVGAFNNIHCRGSTSLEVAQFCHYANREMCGPHAQMILDRINVTPGSGVGGSLCMCKYQGGQRVCLHGDVPSEVNPSLILHSASLTILSLFVIEVLLKLIAFRMKYFTHKFEVFDGIVVVISFALDIASLVEEEAFEAVSLLIILRLWRVIRIVNGAVLSAKAQSDQRLHEARSQAKAIIHAFHKCQTKLNNFERENCALRQQLRVSGGERMKVERQEGEKGGQWEREEGGQGEEGRQQDEETIKRPLQNEEDKHVNEVEKSDSEVEHKEEKTDPAKEEITPC